MEKEIMDSYYRSFKGGKSRIACEFDETAFSLTVGAVAAVIMFAYNYSIAVCTICALLVFAIVLPLMRLRRLHMLNKHIDKVRSEAEEEIVRLKLLFLPKKVIKEAVEHASGGEPDMAIITKDAPFEIDDVLEAIGMNAGRKLVIWSASPPSAFTAEKIGSLSMLGIKEIVIRSLGELVSELGINANEYEIDSYIKEKYKKEKRKRLDISSAFGSNRTKKYLLIGAAAIVFSLFSKHALYLRLIGSIIITASVWLTHLSRFKRKPD